MDKMSLDKALQDIQEKILEDARKVYSEKAIEYFFRPRNFGRLDEANYSAKVTGPCGDTMEIYLAIESGRCSSISFFTDGCDSTLACGSSVTEMAKGKEIKELLKISPSDIIDDLGGLPSETIHCSILAVTTLLKAVAEYFLKNL